MGPSPQCFPPTGRGEGEADLHPRSARHFILLLAGCALPLEHPSGASTGVPGYPGRAKPSAHATLQSHRRRHPPLESRTTLAWGAKPGGEPGRAGIRRRRRSKHKPDATRLLPPKSFHMQGVPCPLLPTTEGDVSRLGRAIPQPRSEKPPEGHVPAESRLHQSQINKTQPKAVGASQGARPAVGRSRSQCMENAPAFPHPWGCKEELVWSQC